MRLRVIFIAVFGATVVASELPLQQRHFEFWSFLDHNRPLTRCSETSAAHGVAIERLRRLENLVDRLQPAGDPKPVLESFDALLKTECFLIASEVQDLPRPDSAASIKDWAERGAFEWLWSYLELPKLGTLPNLKPHIVLPPDVRSTLTLERSRQHALSPFLCPARDANCGAQTRGWKARAELAFAGPLNHEGSTDRAARLSDECLANASSEDPERKYMTWHACIQGRRPKTAAFPIGEFKAPLSGWLVMSGRRGHYEFCDSTTAYDLESGTAVRSESCSGLALKPGGAVDRDATNKARVQRVVGGRVSIENLREAAWMLLFASQVTPIQLPVQTFALPASVEPKVFAGAAPSFGRGFGGNTSMTTLAWRLMVPGGRSYSGQQTWPRSYEAAEDHAAVLINVVEEGFVEGCLRQRPPTPLDIGTSRYTAIAQDLYASELPADYSDAYSRWASLKVCAASK